MAKDSSTPVRHTSPAKAAKPAAAAKRRSAAAKGVRPVTAGDTAPRLGPRSIEKHVVRKKTQARQDAQGAAIRDIVRRAATAVPSETIDALKAILAGAAPDDVAALRNALFEVEGHAGAHHENPDMVLARHWRDGGYPYKNLMSRKTYERAEIPAAGRAAEAAGLGQGDRPARGDPVRRPRRGRQGRHDQALHGAPEPARRARRGAGKAVPTSSAASGTSSATCSTCRPRGEIVLFDRSWYNRAGVERVMGFCTDEEYLEFMRQAPEFERMLVRSGIHLFKFWFSVSREEQRRRFKERESAPAEAVEAVSPIDLASLDKWDDYTRAKEAMFFYTDTADAPWTVIKSDCKKRARLNAMRYVLHQLPYANKDLERSARSIR